MVVVSSDRPVSVILGGVVPSAHGQWQPVMTSVQPFRILEARLER